MGSAGFWQALRQSLLCRFPRVVVSVRITCDLLQLLFQTLVSSSGFQLRSSLEQESALHPDGLFS